MNKIIAIAINEYNDPRINNLNNCINDINALIDILSKKYDFDYIELYTKPEQTTLSFLYNEIYNELINALEDDNILILFAGHGEFNSKLGSSYWLCSDSDKNNVTTWYNVSDLLNFFKASEASHIALISDSCFSGAIFDLNRGGGIEAFESKTSRQALTSGGIEKVGDGESGQNSLFNITLQKILKENNLDDLSFNRLSEDLILDFSTQKKQTPAFGSLINSGDKGGTFFFHLKKQEEQQVINILKIPLDINENVKIDSSFEIPFFNENTIFNSQFINAFVQQLGYSIVNDVRVYVSEDETYSISKSSEMEFYLEVNYTIETNNDKFLSLLINRSDYFGGAHPNHYVYTLNFAFKPERKISFYDIIDYSDYSNLEEFLKIFINKYGEDDCKSMLLDYTTYESINELDFTFNDEYFTIYYFNLFPHAFKGCGIVNIPRDEIKFKIK